MLLNVQSVYSLLKSTLTVDDYVKQAKQAGYTTVGLADHNALFGAYHFYQACMTAGLTPLMGLEVHLPGVVRKEHEYAFLVYAKNFADFQSLMHLSRLLLKEPLDSQAVWDYLTQSAHSLVLISEGKRSELDDLLIRQQALFLSDSDIIKVLDRWQAAFGQDIYLGLSVDPYTPEEDRIRMDFAHRHHLKMVMSQKVVNLTKDEAKSLEILRGIDQGDATVSLDHEVDSVHYLYPYEELLNRYRSRDWEEVIRNTQALVASLQVVFPPKKSRLPKFTTPDNQSATTYLAAITRAHLKAKGLDQPVYSERLEHELAIIEAMGFSDYFLIVADIMDLCRRHRIRTGPGRGSAAGSLVAYLLDITQVDPLAYGLLFERFLNPERQNMPDIDIDIPDDKRQLLIEEVRRKYGREKVAQIATFYTLKAKQVIRDTLKVLGFSEAVCKDWTDRIPQDANTPMTLDRAYRESRAFRQLVDAGSENRRIFELAKMNEGRPRQVSTHAAALVIYDDILETIIPVMDRGDQGLITQYTMHDVEALGLLKMDFLGLRNLTILDSVLKQIQRDTGEMLKVEDFPMDDPETLKLFQGADTNGVFQFESAGIKRVLRDLHPEHFEDIVAVNALYRPGPMQQIASFIKRKKGQEPIDYLLPVLEPILAKTYGVIVYQEEVMEIVVKMAGYTLGEADILRRAMGKKDSRLMQEEARHFLAGAQSQGYEEAQAQEVFNYIYQFANYGFNRSHAVVYSLLAYQLAYLKAHYPIEFYATLLNSGRSQSTSLTAYIQEAKLRLGGLAPLSINRSRRTFYRDGDKLRIGFQSVKGLRQEFIRSILQDRKQYGPFTSVQDFLQRMKQVSESYVKEEILQPLIYSGAFDEFEDNRATLIHNLKALIQGIEFAGFGLIEAGGLEYKSDIRLEFSPKEKAKYEQAFLGFTLAPHPLTPYLVQFERDKDLMPLHEMDTVESKSLIRTLAMVQTIRPVRTRKGDVMAFVRVSDGIEERSLVIFSDLYRKYRPLLEEEAVLEIRAKVEVSPKGEKQLVAQTLQKAEITPTGSLATPTCYIKVTRFDGDRERIAALKELCLENPGPSHIILIDEQRQAWELDRPYRIAYNHRVQSLVQDIFSPDTVVFK